MSTSTLNTSTGNASSSEAASPHGTETVLFVEDDETVRKLTRMILEDLGYRVLSAEDGEHASRLNRSFQGDIDLLLTDVVMPGGDGIEWARRMRHDRPSMPAIFLSAYSREALARDGIGDPGALFLQKPFRPQALARKIREVLDA